MVVRAVDREDVVPLVEELIGLLRTGGEFDRTSPYAADEAKVEQLAKSLKPYGITLHDDGRTEKALGSFADASTLPDEAAVRENVQRLRLALDEDDSALLLGSSKELLESTAKIVLHRVGEAPPAKYPALVTRARKRRTERPPSPLGGIGPSGPAGLPGGAVALVGGSAPRSLRGPHDVGAGLPASPEVSDLRGSMMGAG